MMTQYIGIDVGGSTIKAALVDEQGQLKNYQQCPTTRDDPEKVLQTLTELIHYYQTTTITQVGISIPGVINPAGKMITSGAIAQLHHYAVLDDLQKATHTTVRLVNDANAIALAEHWQGRAKDVQNFVCVPLGTGVGGSIFLNGQLVTGVGGAAGEFGMMLANPEKVSAQTAHLAEYSFNAGAVAGLCRIYNQKLKRVNLADWELSVPQILKKAATGQTEAQESLAIFYQNVATLLLNIRVVLDPSLILIGGGISESQAIINGIQAVLTAITKQHPDLLAIGMPPVLPCQLGNRAGIIGAASQFVKQTRLG